MLFNFDQIQQPLTTETILQQYTEDQLYSFYCPEFTLGDICSPFRAENSPSFGFYERRDGSGTIMWKDSKTGETGGVFKFIERVLRKQGFAGSFGQMLERIKNDLSHGAPTAITFDKDPSTPKIKQKRKISILDVVETKEQDIPKVFLPIWENLGISRNILDAYHVGFAVEVWLTIMIKGVTTQFMWGKSTNDNPIFYYHFPWSGHFKIYRPLEKVRKRKWINTATNDTDIQGLFQCNIEERKPRLLVITKSMKDVMFLRSLGVDAIAFHGEGHLVDAAFITYLRQHCGFIISIYDNDIAGMRGGVYLRNTFGIPAYFIPRCYESKDITDLYKTDYRRCFLIADILNELLKNEYSNEYTGIGATVISGLRTPYLGREARQLSA
jgi:hypothetical protein